jgi:VIT1/CCC1 family predicted Fe2+/Mn2+ transporter
MPPTPADLQRYRDNLQGEVDASFLYRTLADAEPDPDRADIFRQLADAEDRHAALWRGLLEEGGADPGDLGPARRARLIAWASKRFGTRAMLPLINAAEARDVDMYLGQPEATGLPAEERAHARVFANLAANARGPVDIAGIEGWHKGGGAGGPLRAAVFGVNDGLVSNLSLVMGVAGAEPGAEFVRLAGVAGLLAGAFSMAAGEWVSMKAQREVFERQIAVEREELEVAPQEEEAELSLIYQAKGIPRAEAQLLARQIMTNRSSALDTLVREELGLDQQALGSPAGAAASSFVSFAVGAILPVLPYLLGGGGNLAIVVSAIISGVALFSVGAAVSFLTARGLFVSGARMVVIGGLAAGVTFLIGRVIGVQTA